MAYHRETGGVPRALAAGAAATLALVRTRCAPGAPNPRGVRVTGRSRAARLVGAVLAAALTACEPYVQGNGVYLEEDRSGGIAPFVGIRVEDGIQATVTAGAAAQSVVVSGDANVVPYIKAEVRAIEVRGAPLAVLFITLDPPGDDYGVTIPPRAVVRATELGYVAATEASKVNVFDAAAPSMVVDGQGGSEVTLRGAGGESLHATLVAASLDAGSYAVDLAEVSLAGGSRAELHAQGTVTGDAQGASAVDNLLGSGTCDVTLDETSTLACHVP
jgi:hypothetical protein